MLTNQEIRLFFKDTKKLKGKFILSLLAIRMMNVIGTESLDMSPNLCTHQGQSPIQQSSHEIQSY